MKTREIAEFLGAELFGDGEVEITGISAFSAAQAGQITFLENADFLGQTLASCVITESNIAGELPYPVIKTNNPKLAFAKIAAKLIPWDDRQGWHETAIIPPQNEDNFDIRASFIGAHVSIGEGTYIGEGSIIDDGVRIGRNVAIKKFTVIHPNCVIYDNVEIGDSCVIHAGSVIGADGFGYVRDDERVYHKFPQIGTVVIEDNVEIGANTCVDRGALGETRIGEGTKIDNLVQIAHNVQIGKRVVIAAQTGISGSTVIEDDCVIGGQVGMGDHARVQSGAVIGSQAGVLPGKIVRPGVWWGTPVQPLDDYKRQNAHVKGLAKTKDELKDLKRKIADLEDETNRNRNTR
jgi:UDP-3-O-[3-hydroxymyristoyl] glucosamine N-acyltransferase